MKILFLEWNGYGNKDLLEAYHQLGHDVSIFPFLLPNVAMIPIMNNYFLLRSADSPPTIFLHLIIIRLLPRYAIKKLFLTYPGSMTVLLFPYTLIQRFFPATTSLSLIKSFATNFRKMAFRPYTIFPWPPIQPAWIT